MVVSLSVFWIICIVIVVILLVPFVYFHLIKNIDKLKYLLFLPALVIPFIIFSPDIIKVTDCDTYTTDVVVLPTGDFTRGTHAYVMNNCPRTLYVEAIAYGNATTDFETLWCDSGQVVMCPKRIDFVLEEAPDSISVENKKGDIRYMLSCSLTYDEFTTQRLDYFNNLLEENPDDVESLYYKGGVLDEMGDSIAAAECFGRVIDLCTGGVQSYYIAPSLARLERWEQAIVEYKKHINSPTAEKFAVLAEIGYCYMGLGDWGKARTYFEESLKVEDNITVHLRLAMVARQEGRTDDMKKSLEAIWNAEPALSRSYNCVEEIEFAGAGSFSPREKQMLRQVFAAYEEV